MATVRANGVDTYYERRGEGPTVVFVHASMLDHSMWDEQAAALEGDYATVAYDLRGHGRTGPSTESAYPMDLYAEDLRALLDGLDVRKPVLCGLSMGGMVARSEAADRNGFIVGFGSVSMRAKLALGVGALVALAGVTSVATNGGELSEAVMWVVVAFLPAAIVALGGLPSGYSADD